jgi:hypothetical protein
MFVFWDLEKRIAAGTHEWSKHTCPDTVERAAKTAIRLTAGEKALPDSWLYQANSVASIMAALGLSRHVSRSVLRSVPDRRLNARSGAWPCLMTKRPHTRQCMATIHAQILFCDKANSRPHLMRSFDMLLSITQGQ